MIYSSFCKNSLITILISSLITGCVVEDNSYDTVTVSGVAVDGYLENSVVSLNGVNTTTNKEGVWSITYTKSDSNENIVFISGGVDTFTGENYEGIMEAVINGTSGESVVVTPLTSLVSSLVNSGLEKKEALSIISSKLYLSKETLESDPISLLKNGDFIEKKEASYAIKKALMIQKLSEVIGNAISTNKNTKSSIMSSVIDTIALKLKSNNINSFESAIFDVDSILNDLSIQISDSNISEKLFAVSDSALYTLKMINEIDEKELSLAKDIDKIIESKKKAIEIASLAIEKKVNNIASATSQIQRENAKNDVKDVLNRLSKLGGINGISKSINNSTDVLEYSNRLTANL